MFYGRKSLNSVPLLLLVNFVSKFRFVFMYVFLKVSIWLRLTEFITSQKHGSWDFGEIANSVFNQGKSVILSKLFPENISKNSDHDDVVSLYLFSLLELT